MSTYMKYCTRCKNGVFPENIVHTAYEADYTTGQTIAHVDVCKACHEQIINRNFLYKRLKAHFQAFPGKLVKLRTKHEQAET